jgi:sugar O-acyltransferase (sialic acid O-acetyltransferase NeuD family)
MVKVVMFGAGQVVSRAYWYLTHDSPYEVVAFTVDQEYIKEDKLFELPVVPFEDIESIYSPSECKMFLSISPRKMNKLRAEKYYQAKEKGYQLVSYISSRATTWPGLIVGDNCHIQTNSVIEPFAEVGNDVFLGVGTLVSHNSVVKDHCFVAHHAVVLGSVTVEPYCFIGANVTIRDNVTIARECVIGAGALILEDTQEKGVYKGNPPELLPIPSDKLKKI